jgi:Tfp pilus assembly protein PilN
VTTLFFIKPADVYLEIGPSMLKARQGAAGLELPVERLPNGQLTTACRDQIVARLRKFLRQQSRIGRPRAFCAIGAQGVSLRRIALPPAAKENFHPLLELQIEKEFPLPPRQLAWGCLPVREVNGVTAASPRDMIVVAVKREVIEDYNRMLLEANLNPVFTLGALAVQALCHDAHGTYAVLNIGPSHSEFMTVLNGAPAAVRCLAWGERQLAGSSDAAAAFAETVHRSWNGGRLFVAGNNALLGLLRPYFTERLGRDTDFQPLEIPPGEGHSAAILGLRHYAETNDRSPPLVLQAASITESADRRAAPAYAKWAALAAVLALACIGLRYAEAFWKGPALARQLSRWQSAKFDQPEVDRELSFYQYLATNRPPYLSAIAALSDAAGRGTVINSLSVNRQGDLSLRGLMPSSKQATDFRAKLVHSGWFTGVVLEEQAPIANKPTVNVRISAHWRTAAPKAPSSPAPEPAAAAELSKPAAEPPPVSPGIPNANPHTTR